MERLSGLVAGLRALSRHSLGKYELGNPEWHVAVEALWRAKIDATPNNLETARLALKGRVAKLAPSRGIAMLGRVVVLLYRSVRALLALTVFWITFGA